MAAAVAVAEIMTAIRARDVIVKITIDSPAADTAVWLVASALRVPPAPPAPRVLRVKPAKTVKPERMAKTVTTVTKVLTA